MCCGLFAKSCPTLAIPWTATCQAPLTMGFSGRKYWSGLPFPSPGDVPSPGIELASLASICIGRGVLYHCTAWEAPQKVHNIC